MSELPDELQQAPRRRRLEVSDAQRAERQAALGLLAAKKKDELVKARKDSGIEEVWKACEEAYLGIDDANRHMFAKAKWAKPMTMSGPVTATEVEDNENKSNIFVRLTTRYVDMAKSKLAERTLPIDDKAFKFGPTPVPELVKMKDDHRPFRDAQGNMLWRPAEDGEMASIIQANPAAAFMGAQGSDVPHVPVTNADMAKAQMREAAAKAEKAEKRIYDWMVESRYPQQMRKVIFDAARIGVGVLKGPFPDERTRKAFTITQDGAGVLEIVKKISPACKWIDPWNFFSGGNCGEDIHSGDDCAERDYMSPAKLRRLKSLRGLPTAEHPDGEPLYLASQIDKVLAEGPGKCNVDESGRSKADTEGKANRFEIFHITTTLSCEDMMVLGAPGADELPEEMVECFCVLTLVNDSVIRASFNPLEKSGNFGYRTFSWSPRAGHWAGVGVAEQVFEPQRMVNAGTRTWMNNAGKSSGSQIVMDQRAVTPADGSPDIVPDKLWYLTGDAVVDDIRKVFMAVEIPDRGESLFRIIEYAFKLAEELSNIPLVSQGQTSAQDPETFGQAELQNDNANTLMRQQALNLDDSITEPLVDDFYEYLLLDPTVPADEKGDFEIDAHGSVAMVEKAIQERTLMLMGGMVLNPIYGIDPKKWAKEMLRAKRLDPGRLEYTEEELAEMAQQPPPKAPAVTVAEINREKELEKTKLLTESNERIAAGRDQTTLQRAKVDTDRDALYAQAERDRVAIEAQAAENKRVQDRELALLKYANDRAISIDDAKAMLAKAAMELTTQVRLTLGQQQASPQVATPAFEPPGRAQDGHAYTQ